jgi:hypothetical protein
MFYPLIKFCFTSINMDLIAERLREGLQPSLSPIMQIYTELKS